MGAIDQKTADAFASSWNHLPSGSVYTQDQFEDWMAPVGRTDVTGKRVLELGCGNGSLLVHMTKWQPSYLEGVDLGASVDTARQNMEASGYSSWKITQGDATTFSEGGFDLVYSIGVLHHLNDPYAGFQSMIRNTKPGGRFHGWVYAREGNSVVRYMVDPIRKVTSHLPWWFTKYLVALPLSGLFYLYAHAVWLVRDVPGVSRLPLYEYSLWISRREFSFFRHVAFDQLVTPQTAYLPRATIEKWLYTHADIDPARTYVIMRNGNSWKFGGYKKAS